MPYRFPVEAGQILLFTRAAGGVDPDVLDPALPAPPTFVQSGVQFDPDWPFRPRVDQPWLGSGREPSGAEAPGDGSLLHAEQHFEYLRPLRAGTVLEVSLAQGETWTKQSRSGSELHFSETRTEYRDEAGELVVLARGISVTVVAPQDGAHR